MCVCVWMDSWGREYKGDIVKREKSHSWKGYSWEYKRELKKAVSTMEKIERESKWKPEREGEGERDVMDGCSSSLWKRVMTIKDAFTFLSTLGCSLFYWFLYHLWCFYSRFYEVILSPNEPMFFLFQRNRDDHDRYVRFNVASELLRVLVLRLRAPLLNTDSRLYLWLTLSTQVVEQGRPKGVHHYSRIRPQLCSENSSMR